MIPNDVLRRLRYALRINDAGMLELFRAAGEDLNEEELAALLLKEEEEGFLSCSDFTLRSFLDALIEQRRGKREGPKPVETGRLTNNAILRRIRIALNFKEDDVIATLKEGGMTVSKSELSALFRREGHKHYKVCGDQLLRNFLHGLALRRS